jgi:hypothetical protein
MAESIAVRGHTCEGLNRHFAAADYGCVPCLNASGAICGCDDLNPVVIDFCPWCGVDLRSKALPLVTDADDTSPGGEAGRCSSCHAPVGEPHDYPMCEKVRPEEPQR